MHKEFEVFLILFSLANYYCKKVKEPIIYIILLLFYYILYWSLFIYIKSTYLNEEIKT